MHQIEFRRKVVRNAHQNARVKERIEPAPKSNKLLQQEVKTISIRKKKQRTPSFATHAMAMQYWRDKWFGNTN